MSAAKDIICVKFLKNSLARYQRDVRVSLRCDNFLFFFFFTFLKIFSTFLARKFTWIFLPLFFTFLHASLRCLAHDKCLAPRDGTYARVQEETVYTQMCIKRDDAIRKRAPLRVISRITNATSLSQSLRAIAVNLRRRPGGSSRSRNTKDETPCASTHRDLPRSAVRQRWNQPQPVCNSKWFSRARRCLVFAFFLCAPMHPVSAVTHARPDSIPPFRVARLTVPARAWIVSRHNTSEDRLFYIISQQKETGGRSYRSGRGEKIGPRNPREKVWTKHVAGRKKETMRGSGRRGWGRGRKKCSGNSCGYN